MSFVPRSRSRRWADAAIAVLFLVGISFPAIEMYVSGDADEQRVARTELRPPASFPPVEYRKKGWLKWPRTQSLVQFPRLFESWFDDHVGLRRPLIRCYNLAKVFGLTVENMPMLGESAHVHVIVGRDGWLFGSAGGRLVSDFRRTDPFSPDELQAWREQLTKRRDWSVSRGVEHLLLITPNQQTIYPEFMPRSMTRADRPSRLDQLRTALTDIPRFQLLDLRETLTAGREQHPTYHQTDTHWNDFGAYLGYRQVVERLAERGLTKPPLPLEAFHVEVTHVTNYGDLARALNAPVDFVQPLVMLKPKVARTARWTQEGTSADGMPILKSVNDAVPDGRIVVMHDSFMMPMRFYLSEHFREVYYVPTYRFPLEVIEQVRPDCVLEQFVERTLMYPLAADPPNISKTSIAVLAADRNESKR